MTDAIDNARRDADSRAAAPLGVDSAELAEYLALLTVQRDSAMAVARGEHQTIIRLGTSAPASGLHQAEGLKSLQHFDRFEQQITHLTDTMLNLIERLAAGNLQPLRAHIAEHLHASRSYFTQDELWHFAQTLSPGMAAMAVDRASLSPAGDSADNALGGEPTFF